MYTERNYMNDLSGLGSMQNFDDSYDEMYDENYDIENLESLERRGKIRKGTAMKVAQAIAKQPTAGGAKVETTFSFTAQRDGVNIDSILPIPFFGTIDRENRWNGLLPLPALVANIEVFLSDDNQGLDIQYNAINPATAPDYVKIRCTDVPYTSLLSNMYADVFALSKMRIKVSDPNVANSQFKNSLTLVNRSLFGNVEKKPINVSAFFGPNQFQTAIVDVDGTVFLDKNKSLFYGIDKVNNLLVEFNSFVSVYDANQAKSVLQKTGGKKYSI